MKLKWIALVISTLTVNICHPQCDDPGHSQYQLLYAADVIRHGARTPLHFMPNPVTRYNWPVTSGELLPVGINQTYRYGQKVRREFVYSRKLLPYEFQPSLFQKATICTTDVDRTAQSAQSFALGLYPLGTGLRTIIPNRPTLFPIHLCQNNYSKDLPKKELRFLRSVFNPYSRNYRCGRLIEAAYEDGSLKRWALASGFDLSQIQSIIALGDNAITRSQLGLSLSQPFHSDDQDRLVRITNTCLTELYSIRSYARIKIGPILKEIIQKMQDATQNKTAEIYKLYLMHDSDIGSLMTLMRLPVSQEPTFTSNCRLELLRNQHNGKLFVKLLYNGIFKTFPAQVCGTETDYCPFENFKKIIQ